MIATRHHPGMAATDRPVDRGRRQGRATLIKLGDEIRRARTAAGLSQREVGRVAGVAHSTVGRIERSRYPAADLPMLAVVSAVVGLELRVATYPAGTPHRDRAHAALLGRVRGLLHPSWEWRLEVPLPNPGDPRSWDAMARGNGVRVAFEAETGPRDGQELQRRLALKRRDGGVDHVVLVLSDTRGNRSFLNEYRESLQTAFPTPAASVRQALAEGRAPAGSGILIL